MSVMVNRARRPRLDKRVGELVRYRELVRNLVIRDLKARYKNSVLGFLWSLLNPLLMMIVFTVVFTVMLPNNVPKYPVFVLCALLPWNWFSGSISGGLTSVIGNSNLVKKVYFPREALPLSVVLAQGVNFLLALPALFAMMLVFQVPFTVWILLLPVVMLVQLIFTLGIALFLAALNVFFRDTGVIMEVLLQAWFFLTPVVYDIMVLPESKMIMGHDVDVRRAAFILNPMASIIANYRVILYWGSPPAFDFLIRTAVTSLVILICGYWFFTSVASRFGEEI
ncbi:MAG: ABC transporter permease [Anaerolineae bacterium]